MSVTTIVIIGMVEIFLIATMFLSTWKQVKIFEAHNKIIEKAIGNAIENDVLEETLTALKQQEK